MNNNLETQEFAPLKISNIDASLSFEYEKWTSSPCENCQLKVLNSIENAILSNDYQALVHFALFVNREAKYNKNEIEADLYQLKYLFLAKACLLAKSQAIELSYGIQADMRDKKVLYFDLPGFGQVSFHVHFIEDFEEKIDIPPYKGTWCKTYPPTNPSCKGSLFKKIFHDKSIDIDALSRLVDEKCIPPFMAHQLYLRAMTYTNFEENRELLEELIFPLAPTLPWAIAKITKGEIHSVIPYLGTHTIKDIEEILDNINYKEDTRAFLFNTVKPAILGYLTRLKRPFLEGFEYRVIRRINALLDEYQIKWEDFYEYFVKMMRKAPEQMKSWYGIEAL